MLGGLEKNGKTLEKKNSMVYIFCFEMRHHQSFDIFFLTEVLVLYHHMKS